MYCKQFWYDCSLFRMILHPSVCVVILGSTVCHSCWTSYSLHNIQLTDHSQLVMQIAACQLLEETGTCQLPKKTHNYLYSKWYVASNIALRFSMGYLKVPNHSHKQNYWSQGCFTNSIQIKSLLTYLPPKQFERSHH